MSAFTLVRPLQSFGSMKPHLPNPNCHCPPCTDHRAWLERHKRALAEHAAEQRAKQETHHDSLLA